MHMTFMLQFFTAAPKADPEHPLGQTATGPSRVTQVASLYAAKIAVLSHYLG